MSTPVGFAVIGCGDHSGYHVMPGVAAGMRLVAVYDRSHQAMVNATMAAVAAGQRVALCGSYAELLGRSDVEAVVVITGDEDHPRHLMEAVRQGKHVLAEKPMAIDQPGLTTVRDALVLAGHGGNGPLVVSTCHPRRVSDPYMWPKRNLAQLVAKYGKLVGVKLSFDYPVPKRFGKHISLLVDHFPHEIDYLRWLLGGDLPFDVRCRDDASRSSTSKYAAQGNMGGVAFEFYGSRLNISTPRVFRELIELRFECASCVVNTVDGSVSIRPDGQKAVYRSAGPTNYDLHFTRLMAGFAAQIRGGVPGYTVSHRDMMVNTTSTIGLAAHGSFEYVPNRAV